MAEGNVVYSTNSMEHSFNVNGESYSDFELEIKEIIIKDNLCRCGEEEIYHERLTDDLCLTCYHNRQEELRMMEMDWEDYIL